MSIFPNPRFLRSLASGIFAIAAGFCAVSPVGRAGEEEAALAGTTTVLSRKVVNLGTHRITYLRITPPRLPLLPPAPTPAAYTPTPEEIAAEEARAAKTYEHLGVSCLVFLGSPTVTELTWWHEGKRHRAWSNVNFLHLTQLTQLETATHLFAWLPVVSEASVAEIPPEERPAGLTLFSAADTAPEYFFEGTEADLAASAGTLLGLDYLHAHYELHRDTLAADHARREAEAAARAAELAKNPPQPSDSTLYFWKKTTP